VSGVGDGAQSTSAGPQSSDFTLQDNGVAQEFTCAAAESLAVDVTLVIDTSGSVKGRRSNNSLPMCSASPKRCSPMIGCVSSPLPAMRLTSRACSRAVSASPSIESVQPGRPRCTTRSRRH